MSKPNPSIKGDVELVKCASCKTYLFATEIKEEMLCEDCLIEKELREELQRAIDKAKYEMQIFRRQFGQII